MSTSFYDIVAYNNPCNLIKLSWKSIWTRAFVLRGLKNNFHNFIIRYWGIKMREGFRIKTSCRPNMNTIRLLFLIDGIIDATGRADDNGYSITERLHAPGILQPERIFGLTQRFTRTFMAAGNCRFISLDKIDALALADSYEIFRLNLLNIVCTKSQRLTRYPWRIQPKDIRSKIVRFIEARSLRPAGEKTMTITMERLGLELGESRLNVSRELNAMDNEGAISLRRGRIHIAALERLINTTT